MAKIEEMPPDDRQVDPQKHARGLLVALTGSNIFALFVGGLYEYLSLRGAISMGLAWAILVFVWLVGVVGIVISEWVWGKGTKHRIRTGSIASIVLAVLLFGFHRGVSAIVAPHDATTAKPINLPAPTTPLLTWKALSPITYGEGLSEKQLNAHASAGGKDVDGEFVYNPTFGSTLSPGVDTLSVTFIPNDRSRFSEATTTVSVIVEQPLPKHAAETLDHDDLRKRSDDPTCAGDESRPYKCTSDELLAQWAIDKAGKMKTMADEAIERRNRDMLAHTAGSDVAVSDWFEFVQFSNDFQRCCEKDVRSLRAELLIRLGPPEDDPTEERAYDAFCYKWHVPNGVHHFGTIPPGTAPGFYIDAFGVSDYAPFLRNMGLKLKQRSATPKLR